MLLPILLQAPSASLADSRLEGDWRVWDQPGRGARFIARTPSLVFIDSHLSIYFDAGRHCAPFLALTFHPANPEPPAIDTRTVYQIEIRVDEAAPIRLRSAVAARVEPLVHVIHPIPATLLDAIATGSRMIARATLAPQIDAFSLRGSAQSIRRQRALCQHHGAQPSTPPPPRLHGPGEAREPVATP